MTTAPNSTDDDVIVLTEDDVTDSPDAGTHEAPADSDQDLPGDHNSVDAGDLDGDNERVGDSSAVTPADSGPYYGTGDDADRPGDDRFSAGTGLSGSGAFAMPGGSTTTADPAATSAADTAEDDTADGDPVGVADGDPAGLTSTGTVMGTDATGSDATGTTPADAMAAADPAAAAAAADSADAMAAADPADVMAAADPTGAAAAPLTSAGPAGVVQPSADWPQIQAAFVDDPRRAVERAAEVTSAALSALVTAAQEREQALRQDWQAEGAGTEELRTSLQHYRELSTWLVSLSQGL
jgi:hypothetical protein